MPSSGFDTVWNMHRYHREILKQFELGAANPENRTSGKQKADTYLGSKRRTFHLRNAVKRRMLKDWYRDHKDLSYDEFIEFLDSLSRGDTLEEVSSIGELLLLYKDHRHRLELGKLVEWLSRMQGWAEIDSLCQMPFDEKDILSRWGAWRDLLHRLVRSDYVAHRRASIVLLVKTARHTEDTRVAELIFENVDRLKSEKDILITKAISWVLRELSRKQPELVRDYVEANKDSLPAIAVREVMRKLTTGRK